MTAPQAPRWERTADPRTWQARHRGAVLTVTRLPDASLPRSPLRWSGLVEAGGRWEHSAGSFPRRLAAQRWCERALGGQP